MPKLYYSLFTFVFAIAADGQTSPTGTMNMPRYQHTATLLNNGSVLITGGIFSTNGINNYTGTAELYNPQTGTWRYTGIGSQTGMNSARSGHTATLLPDGRVLIAGGAYYTQYNSGVGGTTTSFANSVDIFDPTTETFTPTGPMVAGRGGHSAVLLQDGRVLVLGGYTNNYYSDPQAEIYNPLTQTWTALPNVQYHGPNTALVMLPNGKVLAPGGYTNNVDLFDTATNTWQVMSPLLYQRAANTSFTLPNGQVLVAGGFDGFGGNSHTAELYNAAANNGTGGSVLVPGSLTVGSYHSAVQMAGGNVLLAGGSNSTDCGTNTATVQLYNYTSNSFLPQAPLLSPRMIFTMTLLPNGQVLSAGGINPCDNTVINQAELWGTGAHSTGTITINSNQAAATFSINPSIAGAPTGGPFPVTIPHVPAGTYTVTFNPLAGYTVQQPLPQTQILPGVGSISFSGTYTPLPTLSVSPASLSFSYLTGLPGPISPQGLTISSSGPALSFTVNIATTPPGGSWLSVSQTSGTTPLKINVMAARLSPLVSYSGTITISAPGSLNGSVTVPVSLTLFGAPSGTGTITITSSPSGAFFQLAGPGLTFYSGNTPYKVPAAPAGDYRMFWSALLGGYTTPPNETKTLAAGGSITFVGTYAPLPPVVLIHGYCEDPTAFGKMESLLSAEGFHVYPFSYQALTQINSGVIGSCPLTTIGVDYSIEQIASCFGSFVQSIRNKEGKSQVDVIAHSEGGMVARAWMAGLSAPPLYGGDIARLATVGTPHYGQAIRFNAPGCSALQASELTYGSDFISRLHDQWQMFQQQRYAIPNSHLLFIAGTHGKGSSECKPSSLFQPYGSLLKGVPCNDGLVDIDSAVLPTASVSANIRYVPYQHCDSGFAPNLLGCDLTVGMGSGEVDINDATHNTYRTINEWLLSGVPIAQCCGPGTINYTPSFFTDLSKDQGLLLLRFRDSATNQIISNLNLVSISFDPRPDKTPDAFPNTSSLTIVLPAPNTYNISLQFAGYEPVTIRTLVQFNKPTVPDPLLLAHK